MTAQEAPALTQVEAMIIVLNVTNVYVTLMEEDMPVEYRHGVTLLFEGLVAPLKGLLPNTPALGHIFEMIQEVESLTRDIRHKLKLPPKM